MIEILILYIIRKREKTIYSIRKEIIEIFGAFTKPSIGTIYPALKRLLKEKDHLRAQNAADYLSLDPLFEKYKAKLAEIEPDEEVLANYVISVSYDNAVTCKALAWRGYGDYIIKNVTHNSQGIIRTRIEEVDKESAQYEFLGKYYNLIDEADA